MRRIDSILAIIGGSWGTLSALFLVGMRVANTEPPQFRAEWPGIVAFLALYLTPFALSLLALRWQKAARAGVWLAAGIVALLASRTALSGVSLVFVPAAPFLVIAAVITFIRARHKPALTGGLALILLLAVIAAGMLVLISTPGQGRCWQLVNSSDGPARWERTPYSQQHTIEADSPVVTVTCTSDIITPLEGAAALGLLAAGSAGAIYLERRARPSDTHSTRVRTA